MSYDKSNCAEIHYDVVIMMRVIMLCIIIANICALGCLYSAASIILLPIILVVMLMAVILAYGCS